MDKNKAYYHYIKNNNFKVASAKFSISNSSNKGGEIGWVKETLLSKNISNILNKLKKGEMTKPLKYPNGYLIIKINDKNVVELDNLNDFGAMKSEYSTGSKLAIVHLEQALTKMKNNLNNSRKKNEIMED